MWRRLSLFCLGLMAVALSTQASFAQGYERRWRHDKDRWELLGSRSVGFVVDKDTIRVGADKGAFKQLVLVVRKNAIHLDRVTVIFGNGDRQTIRVDDNLRDGERTRPLDLEGDARVIREIEMVYRSRPSFKGEAIVEVYGEKGRPHRPVAPVAWVELGCQKVGFLGDRDSLVLPAREDRFIAFRLHVKGTAVKLKSMRVHFRSGDSMEIGVPQTIHSGDYSSKFDLPRPRHITRVDMNYESKLSFKGEATACVQGLQ